MTVEYDSTLGIIKSALRFRSTVIPLVILRPEFFILLGINLTVTFAYKVGYFVPDEYHTDLPLALTGVTGGLMTFFVVFYNGNVFTRYQRLYELTKGMNEHCLYVVSILDKELKDKAYTRRLSRMLLASCFLFFFERTPISQPAHVEVAPQGPAGPSNISAKEWFQLIDLGLLLPLEVELLQKHCDRLGQHAIPSFMLLQWSMKLYREKLPRLNELDKMYLCVRKCQEDVVELLELPMPFQYYHIMNVMLLLNLLLWAYAMALQDSYWANVIFAFVQLMFQGLRELSIALADPYGTDDTDFPVNIWMTELYHKINCIIEDAWEPSVSYPPPDMGALPQLHKNKTVIDLLIDAQEQGSKKQEKPPKTKVKNQGKTSAGFSHKKQITTEDGSVYTQLPQKEMKRRPPHHGEDSEDSD